MRGKLGLAIAGLATLLGCSAPVAPEADAATMPVMRWDFRPEAQVWTAATLAALQSHGASLVATEPADIERFCPGYPEASLPERRAFWAGLLSALAKHESTWQPRVEGGGGRWLGLLQIDPRSAKGHGCAAQTASALYDGAANLQCGVRIAAAQVSRDGEVMGRPGRWRGVARDWAPFRSAAKVEDMAAWTRAQDYCQR